MTVNKATAQFLLSALSRWCTLELELWVHAVRNKTVSSIITLNTPRQDLRTSWHELQETPKQSQYTSTVSTQSTKNTHLIAYLSPGYMQCAAQELVEASQSTQARGYLLMP